MKDWKPFTAIVIAAVLWFVMFSPWTAPHVNFWVMMTFSGLTLTAYSTWASPGWWKDIRLDLSNILLGVVLAAVLWGVFWVGDKLSSLMFDFARPQVDMIYGMKEGENPWVLTVLMLFIIGPAEEIFWRGYLQKSFSKKWNPNMGFIVTTLMYSLVHVSKFNFMLIMAAAVAGFVWGLAYRFYPEKFGAILLSHALWDCAVFIWFPI
ncbi:MAG: CPBP family intramembrane metalloprotease [Bacteroidales bacterium]|nr:CPBP family intramembrane metalloprotease [Bacteroidales bacterium]MBQ9722682.1 CPBP family intramembrane metalloprotease [Bacteroidales bacterium]